MQIEAQTSAPQLSESGIPTQQIACLWNKSLKALSVWHFPGLPEICSKASGGLREGV